MMAVLLLMLLAEGEPQQGWRQALSLTVSAVGLLGLLVSFSRTGWLALASGVLFWLMSSDERRKSLLRLRQLQWQPSAAWLPLLTVPLFLILYYDLVFGRFFHLDSLIEARSIQERLRSAQIALQMIAAHPWLGVGAGNALEAAQRLRTGIAPVHNVPLLVVVELGLLGGICWLFLMVLPLLPNISAKLSGSLSSVKETQRLHRYSAAWFGVLIAAFFDTPLWLTTSWRAALLLGLLAALQVQSGAGRKVET
jgi:O-antigen ligase